MTSACTPSRASNPPTRACSTRSMPPATAGSWDAFVAVGGGSSIDTAKAVNLLTTNPGELLDYVNRPIGGGLAPAQPLQSLCAVPTTTGTGSESTTICVLDVLDRHVKTGISHARLRPTPAVVDPELTVSSAAHGDRVLGIGHPLPRPGELHRPGRTRPSKPSLPSSGCRTAGRTRSRTCGPSGRSRSWPSPSWPPCTTGGRCPGEDGTGSDPGWHGVYNAGVHVPHANAYPIAGRVRDYRPADYPQEEPLIPHRWPSRADRTGGLLRHAFAASPDRHLRAARLLGTEAAPTPRPASCGRS